MARQDETTPRRDDATAAEVYDAEYYASHLGVPYTWSNPWWPRFFGRIADAVVADVRPASALDAGCALGFLVAALRERGVDAYGIDISEYAIGQVPPHVRPFCSVESITTPLERDFDLVVCIEVLEHLAPEDAEPTIDNLCAHARHVLFSSTPTDEAEPTHRNVRQPAYWARLFAERGFFRDAGFDAGVVAPHACLFTRASPAPAELAAAYEGLYVDARLREAVLDAAARAAAERAERRAQEAEARAATSARQVEVLERELAHWEAVQERAGWRIYSALFALRARVAPRGTLRDRAVRRGLRLVLEAAGRGAAAAAAPGTEARKAVLFLSGCPGDAKRYRADHQAEQLAVLGTTADALLTDEIPFGQILDRYRCVVLHRVAWDRSVERLLEDAPGRGVRVLFDTDDLVFEPDALDHVAALEEMDEAERKLYVEGVHRYRRTLARVGAAVVSTDALADRARGVQPRVEVAYNAVSREMVRLAETAAAARAAAVRPFTAAYFSGTPTHARDFAEAAESLLWMLEEYPRTRFLAVGHLRLDERFDRFGERVERVPLQPWRSLPEVMARVDANLAPLEPDNPFTDSKSCLKYIEAGLLGIPTIASPRRDFVRAIRHGENGLLAESPAEWRSALKELVESPERAQRLGAAARADVLARHTTVTRARALSETVGRLGGSATDAPLTINWVVRAPLPRTGGYRTIFRLATELARRGHDSRMYVEPVAHLHGLSSSQIEAFLAEHFGPLPFSIHRGHADLAAADVSLATNWPTAPTVAAHETSLFKGYLVQDYEPDFYAPDDPLHAQARETYDLPLRHLCYGAALAESLETATGTPADALDFALEPDFRVTRPPRERERPLRVLFFAKPDQPRRGFAAGAAALHLLHERAPEVEIVLFGAGDDELPAALPFPYRNLGSLATDDLAAALNDANVFLSLSLTNISHAPYEAMACGCAVVEAKLPSVEASLRHGENCLLAAPEPAALTDALLRLLRDDALRVRLAEQAARDVAAMTWESTAGALEELLLGWAFVRLDPTLRAAG